MSDKNILYALYENYKQFVVVNYRIHGSKSGYSESFAYAISHDLCPIYQHEPSSDDRPSDPYIGCYRISYEVASNVVKYVDEQWLNGNLCTFYELENHFGGKDSRWELLCILRYSFLDGRFDDTLWKRLGEHAPVEAHSIDRELASWEI